MQEEMDELRKQNSRLDEHYCKGESARFETEKLLQYMVEQHQKEIQQLSALHQWKEQSWNENLLKEIEDKNKSKS